MTVVVWSERNELHDPTGTEHDCYVAAPLMCLVYGGKVDYPLGIYTAQEREALERSDTRPDEEGGTPDDADLAIKTRYGLAMHKVAEASLGEAWKVGRALSVGRAAGELPGREPAPALRPDLHRRASGLRHPDRPGRRAMARSARPVEVRRRQRVDRPGRALREGPRRE
jgi:hypothetical protein